ncbi:hypothetical protein SLEP1_g52523 [Rubroshorea leprosula]|uniref:LOB domain-containing protein n=1 Tax=Rubroshorea leprosula TaxID=152421 RepID=A0AAV5MAB3_9ROSI|nr:hypothetical protein SLEP1_g52523 [Rubroshorea leprosula]
MENQEGNPADPCSFCEIMARDCVACCFRSSFYPMNEDKQNILASIIQFFESTNHLFSLPQLLATSLQDSQTFVEMLVRMAKDYRLDLFRGPYRVFGFVINRLTEVQEYINMQIEPADRNLLQSCINALYENDPIAPLTNPANGALVANLAVTPNLDAGLVNPVVVVNAPAANANAGANPPVASAAACVEDPVDGNDVEDATAVRCCICARAHFQACPNDCPFVRVLGEELAENRENDRLLMRFHQSRANISFKLENAFLGPYANRMSIIFLLEELVELIQPLVELGEMNHNVQGIINTIIQLLGPLLEDEEVAAFGNW